MSTDPETPDAPDGLDHHDEESEADDEAVNDAVMHDAEDDEGAIERDGAGEGEADAETERTLPNGRTYTVSDEPRDYSVFDNPPNLAEMRQRLFSLEDPVELPVADWQTYFPFVDNIWRKMRTTEPPPEDVAATVDYYACRLRRGAAQKPHTPRPTPEGKQQRKKRVREEKTCAMTMRVVYNHGPIETCTISKATDGVMRHSHDLDYVDGTKRNTGIMDTARREAAKAYLPASIFWKMWEEPDKMQAAGGKFMKMSDVRNVQYAWRQGHQQIVLKAHKGFNQQRAPRQPPAPPPPKPQFQPSMQPGVFGRLEPGFLGTIRAGSKAYCGSNSSPHHSYLGKQLDGRISQVPGIPTAVSGLETKAMTHYLRSRHDAILVGVSTAIADNPALNCRLANPGGYGGLAWEFQPRPIIIDPHARLRIHPDMKVLKTAAEGRGKAPWVVVAPGALLHPVAVSTLKAHGGEYLMINDYHPAQGGLNWEGVFHVLFREGIKSVMVEGGGIVLSELLKMHRSHLIDSIILTIAPTFFGKAGVMVSPDPTFDPTGRPIATRLRNVRWQPMGDADVVMCGHMTVDQPPLTNGMLSGIEEYSRTAPGPPNLQQQPQQPRPQPAGQQPPPGPPPPSQPQPPPQTPIAQSEAHASTNVPATTSQPGRSAPSPAPVPPPASVPAQS
ncbi:RibD domain-containing protein [Cladophialophora immunda]|nr:RibD domain-containing protein [Cladophialophora immunda]